MAASSIRELVPLDQLDPYIQDALDLIESPMPRQQFWGRFALPAWDTRPHSFENDGVGNEQWDTIHRALPQFASVLKEKHLRSLLVSDSAESKRREISFPLGQTT